MDESCDYVMFLFRESTVTVTTAGVSTAMDCQDTRMVMSALTEQIRDKRQERQD